MYVLPRFSRAFFNVSASVTITTAACSVLLGDIQIAQRHRTVACSFRSATFTVTPWPFIMRVFAVVVTCDKVPSSAFTVIASPVTDTTVPATRTHTGELSARP